MLTLQQMEQELLQGKYAEGRRRRDNKEEEAGRETILKESSFPTKRGD